MEGSEGQKMKTIQGVNLLKTNTQESTLLRSLKKYWKEEDIHIPKLHMNNCTVFKSGVNIQNPRRYDWVSCPEYPRPLVSKKVNLGINSSFRYGIMNFKKSAILKERTIAFKFGNGKYFSAFWYINTKTLLISEYIMQAALYETLVYLEENGYISQLPTVSLEKETIPVIEIHDGNPEIVYISEPKFNVTIGTDPEFEIVKYGKAIQPPSYYQGTKTEIGLDGAGRQIELRPKGGSIDECLTDLTRLMCKLQDPISVIGHTYALGGHIHVGLGKTIYPTDDLLWLYDYFLGKPTMALSGNARGSYNKLSAYETKDWGFEYRTPPAAIFINPNITKLAFNICYYITIAYVNEQLIRIKNELQGLSTGSIDNFAYIPPYEDYANYCGFSKEDYEQWKIFFIRYRDMLDSPKLAYLANVSHNWDETKPSHTNFGAPCGCGCKSCPQCNPNGYIMYNIECEAYDMDYERTAAIETAARNARRIEEQTLTAERNALYNTAARLGLSFNDEWSYGSLKLFVEKFVELTGNIPYSNTVYIFGLASNRGLVTSGYSIDGIDNVNLRPNVSHEYGIPRCARMGSDGAVELLNQSAMAIHSMEVVACA